MSTGANLGDEKQDNETPRTSVSPADHTDEKGASSSPRKDPAADNGDTCDKKQSAEPQTTAPKPPRRLRIRSALSILLVTMASGLLFQISSHSAAATHNNANGDLVSLVRARQSEVASMQVSRDQMAARVATLTGTDPSTPTSETTEILGGADKAVSGPGVVVVLTDAPPEEAPPGVSANDLVIHQQDIEDVLNALWAGGAEAITVQGERISSRTVIRCIGNVILVGGTSYAPPYEIAAIGDVEKLTNSVENDPRVVNYRRYVALYGLGWEMETKESIFMPANSQDTILTYAKVVD